MPGIEPYLSLVVTARNDDHGGNLLGRMQAFVSGWIEQARRYRIPSELIIVEWNPPAGRPGLIDALQWPDDLGWCEVRFVEVPPEIHARYDHGKALPLYQMIAKNVGIRRARGRFVLATNIDILVSSELAEFLSKQLLDGDRMYRIDRHDAMNEVPIERPIEEQLEYCRTHLIRVNTREGTFNVSGDGRPTLSPNDVASVESGLLFGSGWFAVESHVKGENFRWASESAELLLPAGARGGLADDSAGARPGDRRVAAGPGGGSRTASRWRGWRSTGAAGCACRWPRPLAGESRAARADAGRDAPNSICARCVSGSSAWIGSSGCRRESRPVPCRPRCVRTGPAAS